MSITISNVLTNLNTYLGDSSTDRISDAERYQAMTEATSWLQEELGNEHMVNSYQLNYLDGIHYYKVTTGLADLLTGGDLRRDEDDHFFSFSRKSPREIATEIAQGTLDPSWAIERKDGDAYIVINYPSKNRAKAIDMFEGIDGWTGSGDAENITLDTNEFKEGVGSLNFDVDVSNTVGNSSSVFKNTFLLDLQDLEDLGSFVFDIYLPDTTETTGVFVKLSSDNALASYWVGTVTTDLNGNSFKDGWNRVKINWADTTLVGTPNSTALTYFELGVNYSASQTDDTDYRIDNFYVVKPEELTFHYVSWNVGTDTSGLDITSFAATTDIPFFSGRYDQYRYVIAHKAASILYYSALRLPEQGAVEESECLKALKRYRSNFESNVTKEVKTFKIFGVNLRNNRRRNRR